VTENISWPKLHIDYAYTVIAEIASPCDFERVETYGDNIDHYESNNYTYIPLPTDGKYYDVSTDSLKELSEDQWVSLEETALLEMSRLLDHDFLLMYDQENWFEVGNTGVEVIERDLSRKSEGSVYTNPYELAKDWPQYRGEVYNILKDVGGLYIVTLADLNDRRIRAVLYQHISGIEVILSHAVEQAYSDGEDLIKDMNEVSIGRWKKAEFEAGQLHPSKYMQLGELKHVSSNTAEITDTLGYEDETEFNQALGGIKKLRNSVMHPTKNLISNKNDLRWLNQTLERLEEFIEGAGGRIRREH